MGGGILWLLRGCRDQNKHVVSRGYWVGGGCGTYMCLHHAVRIFLSYPNHHKKITPLINHITLVHLISDFSRASPVTATCSSIHVPDTVRIFAMTFLGWYSVMPAGNPDNLEEGKSRVCRSCVLISYFLSNAFFSPLPHLQNVTSDMLRTRASLLHRC